MKLAFCLYKYFPYGGLQRDFLKIAVTCQNRGHQIRIYTLSWVGDIPEGFEVIVVPVSSFTNHSRYEKYYQWVREDLELVPVDVVVGINKMPGLDVYYAADSCYEEKARTQRSWLYRQLPRYQHFSKFEKAVFGKESTTEIMMISEIQAPFFRKHYDTQIEKMHFLPPGISRDRISSPDADEIRADLRKEFDVNEDEHLLLMVGSGFIKKGVKRSLYAMRSLPRQLRKKTKMFIVGEDNPAPFKRLIWFLGLRGQIKILDGREDVPRFLMGADVLLHPAIDENAGIVLLEALVAGLPVLATDICGYGHYVKETGIGCIIESPFTQRKLNEELKEFLQAEHKENWREKGLKFSRSANIYSMALEAANLIERLAYSKSEYHIPGLEKGELAFCLYKYFPFGGLQRDFVRIAGECQNRGYKIRVYTLSWEGPVPDDVEIILVPSMAITNHRRYKLYHEWVRDDIRKRPVKGVVGFNKMPDLDVYYAADSCYEEKAQTQRSWIYRHIPRYKYFSRFEKAVFDPQSKTEILMISDIQKPLFMKHYGTPEQRFHSLPPGIDRDRVAGADQGEISQSLRNEFAIAEDEHLILMIGSGFITKGLDRAIKGLQSLPDDIRIKCRMIVIGKDNPTPFLRLAKRLGVNKQVEILDGRDDIPRFLAAADLLVHPAYTENTGTVLLEAIVAGLPVLATDVCGYARFVTESSAGKLVPSPYLQDTFNSLLKEMLTSTDQEQWRCNGINYAAYADIYNMPNKAAEYIDQVIG